MPAAVERKTEHVKILMDLGYDPWEIENDADMLSALKAAINDLTRTNPKDGRISQLQDAVKALRKPKFKEKKTRLDKDKVMGRKSKTKASPVDTGKVMNRDMASPKDLEKVDQETQGVSDAKVEGKNKFVDFLNSEVKSRLDDINNSLGNILKSLKDREASAEARDDDMREAINAAKKSSREDKLEGKGKGLKDKFKDKIMGQVEKTAGNFFMKILKFALFTWLGSAVSRLITLIKDPAVLLDPIKKFFNAFIAFQNFIMKAMWSITGQPINDIIKGIETGANFVIESINKATSLLFLPPIPSVKLPKIPGPFQIPYIPLSKTAQAAGGGIDTKGTPLQGASEGGIVAGKDGIDGVDGLDAVQEKDGPTKDEMKGKKKDTSSGDVSQSVTVQGANTGGVVLGLEEGGRMPGAGDQGGFVQESIAKAQKVSTDFANAAPGRELDPLVNFAMDQMKEYYGITNTVAGSVSDGAGGFRIQSQQELNEENNAKLPFGMKMTEDGQNIDLGRRVADTARMAAELMKDPKYAGRLKEVGKQFGYDNLTAEQFGEIANQQADEVQFQINRMIPGTESHRLDVVANEINQSTSQSVQPMAGGGVVNAKDISAAGGGKVESNSGIKIKGMGPDTQLLAAKPGESVLQPGVREQILRDTGTDVLAYNKGPNANRPTVSNTNNITAASTGGTVTTISNRDRSNRITAASTGGIVKDRTSLTPKVTRMNVGGLVPAPYPEGDDILNSFPMMMGYKGGGDVVNAKLTPGEIVMNEMQQRRMKKQSGFDPKSFVPPAQPGKVKFASGGVVAPGADVGTPVRKGGGGVVVINQGNKTTPSPAPSGGSGGGDTVPNISSTDPNNMIIPVVKSIYNIMG